MKRFARYLPVAGVAGIAAYASYFHQVHVALAYGERPEVAWFLPGSVDGMLVVATIAMVDDRRAERHIRPWARFSFWLGVTASVAANVAGAQLSVGGLLIAGWPAVALLCVVEILARVGRPVGMPPVPAPVLAAPSFAELPAAKPVNGSRAPRLERSDEDVQAHARRVRLTHPGITQHSLASTVGVGVDRLRRLEKEGVTP